MDYTKSILKSSQFHMHMTKLIINGNVLVPFGENHANFEAFMKYCNLFGLHPNGGAIANDCTAQIVYIDK